MIGTKIRDLRIEKGYSQGTVSKLLGIPQSTLSDIEHNRYEPKLKVANQLAKILGFSLEDLLEREVTKQ